jgi:acyl-CoA synthetase (AMP-forming)/AMP-acid ligase II
MMDHLINKSKHPESGFYLNNLQQLSEVLKKRSSDRFPSILIGVSYALLDLAEQFPLTLPENIIIMETGGMKGRRKELIREDLHFKLKKAFNLPRIHSEYGMTELLSQAYTSQSGKFSAPKWMKVFARDIYDPFSILPIGQRGGLNVIDLANINSCCFIATGDLGTVYKNGEFDIIGRLDHSEVRGCNLMME